MVYISKITTDRRRRNREIFILKTKANYPSRKIAEIYDLTINSIDRILRRAKLFNNYKPIPKRINVNWNGITKTLLRRY